MRPLPPRPPPPPRPPRPRWSVAAAAHKLPRAPSSVPSAAPRSRRRRAASARSAAPKWPRRPSSARAAAPSRASGRSSRAQAMSEHSDDEGTYEMLWDCRSCGTQKLLGLTHRRCPNCGNVQDPAWRYYPSDEERVLAKDHAYAGVDRTCPACGTAMSRAAAFCANCGRELKDAKDVVRRAAQVQDEDVAFDAETVEDAKREHAATKAPPKPKRRSPWPRRLLIGGLVVVAAVLVLVFWKKQVGLSVQGHTWERAIDIERFAPRSDSSWCDA